MKYELGIYKVLGYNDTECKEVLLTNASWDECIELKNKTTLGDKEYFDILEVNEDDLQFCGQSWLYLADGTPVKLRDLYEYFGFEE